MIRGWKLRPIGRAKDKVCAQAVDMWRGEASGEMAQKLAGKKFRFWKRKVLTNGDSNGSICKLSVTGPRNKANTKEIWKNLKKVLDK